MLSNVGHKIKILAILILVFGVIATVIWGIVLLNREESSGWTVLILGPLTACVIYFLLYGFGELIERVAAIDQKLGELTSAKNDPGDTRLKEMRERDHITEEEYRTALSFSKSEK